MSDATITNFVTPIPDVISWVVSQLQTYSGWTVYKYHKTNYEEMFFYLLDWKAPSATVIYTGSTYTDNIQRRVGTFAVIVADEDHVDANGSADRSQSLLKTAISLLDHEISEEYICRVVEDKPIYFKNAGVTAYEINFKFDDH